MKPDSALNKRNRAILAQHQVPPTDVLGDAKLLLYELLEPSKNCFGMAYRYEHCIRVMENCRMLAECEGFPCEPLMLGGLLHDCSYRMFDSFEYLHLHAPYSAELVSVYLDAIDYDKRYREDIVRGIAMHDCRETLPHDATPFQLCIRDADDIDRTDMIRIATIFGNIVNGKTNREIIIACEDALVEAERFITYPRGTETAKRIIRENCEKRIRLLREILSQARKGFHEPIDFDRGLPT